MNNKFEEMMAPMMEAMMEKMSEMMMQTMMNSMMNSMMATVTPTEKETVPVKQVKTMSREEFLSLEEEEDNKLIAKHNASLVPLEFICEQFKPKNAKKLTYGLKYNKYVANKAVWTYNHLMIKKNYPAIKYSNGYYYASSLSDLKAFASQYPVVENLTEEQFKMVKEYWDNNKNK